MSIYRCFVVLMLVVIGQSQMFPHSIKTERLLSRIFRRRSSPLPDDLLKLMPPNSSSIDLVNCLYAFESKLTHTYPQIFVKICALVDDVEYLSQGAYAKVFKATQKSNKETIIIKVTPYEKSVACVSNFYSTFRRTGKGVNLIYRKGCAAEEYPAEAFALKVLNGLSGQTPKLLRHIRLKLDEHDVIIMEYFPSEYRLSKRIFGGAAGFTESRVKVLVRNLLEIQNKILLRGIIHLDVHSSNVFFFPSNEVKLIDFNMIDLDVEKETPKISRSFVGPFSLRPLDMTVVLLYPPEFWKFIFKEANDLTELSENYFRYIPGRWAVFQCAAIWFHTSLRNHRMILYDLVGFYRYGDDILLPKFRLSKEGYELIASMLKSNYLVRITLDDALNSDYLIGKI